MLTTQAKKLRETADEVKRIKDNNVDWLWRDAITLDAAVKEMREAADTIENLLDRLTGTCHMVLKDGHEEYGETFFVWWECDKCGGVLPNLFGMPERHCPSCGRRVVE